MRRIAVLLCLAAAAVAAVPTTGEAGGRRGRWRTEVAPAVVWPSCPCPCPAVAPPPWVGPTAVAPPPQGMPPAAPVAPWAVTIKGRTYQIVPHPDAGDEKKDEADEASATVFPGGGGGLAIPAADRFAGTARRLAKTSIFNGPVEPTFSSVTALIGSLPANSTMVGTIPSTPTSNRVAAEQRNVRVKAFIYAFKKENDKDYHVIIGDAPGTPNLKFLNTEVSGIPIGGTTANRATLTAVRTEFKVQFGLGASGPNSYFRPNPPVPVTLTGSLFWDVDHENPPYVGPNDFKPKTPFEIHPISELEF